MISWEDIVYNAESTASSLANLSLRNPTNLFSSLPIMYGAGLLTAASPCVWGVLPLTMSYISAAAGERKDRQTTLPTLAFAGGLATVFCSLGILAATLGGVFGSSGSDNVIIPILSNTVCLAMGLQLLGFVQLPLPSLNLDSSGKTVGDETEPVLLDGTGQILTKETEATDNKSGLFRTFLLGGSSALVASPCATPVLTSILTYVANAQNIAQGAALLLGYTLGYSTPLLLMASSGGQLLVELRDQAASDGWIGKLSPWITPLTGGILLWYGTNGMLTALFGDPSLAGLAPILE